MNDASFLESPTPGLRRSERNRRRMLNLSGELPSKLLSQLRSPRVSTREDSKLSSTCKDLGEATDSGRVTRSARKRPHSQIEQTQGNNDDDPKPSKKALIVKLQLKSLTRNRQFQGRHIDNDPFPDQTTSDSSSEDDEDDAITTSFPLRRPSYYRESTYSEQSSENAADEADRYALARTPIWRSSPAGDSLPPKLSVPPASPLAPQKTLIPPQSIMPAITPEKQQRTILRVSLLSGASGYVPLRLRSCMSVSAFFTSVSTASGVSRNGESAMVMTISAAFDWKAETDIDKRIYIRRDLDDSFDIFLETIAEAPVWEQEGTRCGIAVEVVDTIQST